MKEENIFSAFPVPLGFHTLSVDNYEIVNYMDKLDYYENLGTAGAYTNSDILLSRNRKVLDDLPELKSIFTEKINYHIREVYKWNVDFQFTKSWVTKAHTGGFSHEHRHANNLLSGCYYPFGDKEFNIMFKSPLPYSWDIPSDVPEEPIDSVFAAKQIKFVATDNLLIIFPSYLKHKVMPNNSNDIRYSLAFNVFPKGKISRADSEITIGEVS